MCISVWVSMCHYASMYSYTNIWYIPYRPLLLGLSDHCTPQYSNRVMVSARCGLSQAIDVRVYVDVDVDESCRRMSLVVVCPVLAGVGGGCQC